MSAGLESLESRRMLSASLKAGVLRISGTGGDDRIKLGLAAGRIVVTTNGVNNGQFLGPAVRKISINAGNGDDYVSMSARITVATILNGGAGDDVLVAGAGNDVLFGGDGDDVLRGMAGDDRLDPGTGDNLLDGGTDGSDTVDYSFMTTGMWIDLLNHYSYSGTDDAHDDSFYSIENAEGTQERDHMTGSYDSKFLRGNGGNDELQGADAAKTSLYGGDGDDTLIDANYGTNLLDGGPGFDKVDYSRHLELPLGVEVSLDGVANDGEPNEKDNALVESIIGTWASDKLTGNEKSNLIYGEGGADTIVGGDGNDTLRGEYGGDYLDGGPGDDLIDGRGGSDTLIGGAGRDNLYGGDGDDILRARDFELDYVSGGTGRDRALIDLNIDVGLEKRSDTMIDVEVASDLFA